MRATERRAARAVRAERGALLPFEIRALRQRLHMTQADLERLLGVGPKTVVRWERGTVLPNAATNALLRLLDEVPEAMAWLVRWRRVPAITVDQQGRRRFA